MSNITIAGYRFTELTNLPDLKQKFHRQCSLLAIMGTILLSNEGININLSGSKDNVNAFKAWLQTQESFSNMRFHQHKVDGIPYQRLKIKIKKEIITFRKPDVDVSNMRAPSLPPKVLKEWLDEGRDIVLLDTRNDYEVEAGTFVGALDLKLKHFGELPDAVAPLDREKTIVMFCTGGIRCEKAALHMQHQGFSSVYQLDGGILGYFSEVGGAHYQGGCFVFDERVVVASDQQAANF